MNKEIEWRQCNFNQEYYISEYGDIKSMYKNKKYGGFLPNGSINNVGYKYYMLKDGITGKGKWYYAHRLVAQHWHQESYFDGAECNHKDGNKLNCHYTNLEWVTHSYNIMHSYVELQRNIPVGPAHHNWGKSPSDETKKLMSQKKLGVLHPKFKGYYIYNNIRYASSQEASQETGIRYEYILRWAKINKNGWSFELK